MAASAGTVTLDLDANSVKMVRELLKAQKATQRTGRKMQRSMDRSFKSISRSAKVMGAAVIGAVGVHTIRAIADAGLAMERFERSLKTVTGSAEGAKREMEFITDTAKRLGLDLESTAGAYSKLAAAAKGTILEGEGARDIFVSISEAATVLGLTAAQAGGALTAIEQMISKGKVSAEELRGQLGERLPGAFQIAARAMGVTTSRLDDMLKKGEITASDMLPKLARELKNTFGPGVEDASNSAQAAINNLGTAMFELKASIAKSGVLEALAEFARVVTFVVGKDSGFGLAAEKYEAEITSLELLQNRLIAQIKGMEKKGAQEDGLLGALVRRIKGGATVDEIKQQLTDVTAKLKELKAAQLDILTGAATLETITINTAKLKELRAEMEKIFSAAKNARAAKQKFNEEFDLKQRFDAARDSVKATSDELDDFFSDAEKKAEDAQKAVEDLGLTFASAFEDAIVQGQGLRELLKGILQDIVRIAARIAVTQPLANFFSAAIGNIFGGPKAAGGPVSAGGSYLVGEKGPELFAPGSSGMIIPNHKLNSSGGVTIQNTIDARGADEARIMRVLPPILEQAGEAIKADILQLQAEGRF